MLSSTLLLACASTTDFAQSTPASGADQPGADQLIVVTIDNAPQLDLRRAGSTLRGYFSPGAYHAGPTARQVAEQLGRDYHLARRDAWPIRALQVHCIVYEVPAGVAREDVIASLARDPRVESVQPMQTFRLLAGPSFEANAEPPRDASTLNVLSAHRWARGRGVRVGVIDTGVDMRHRELRGKVAATADFVAHDWGSFLADRHGTAVAGVIAASGGNRLGLVGVAPEATLIVAKACWYDAGDRLQSAARCSSFTLARALAFALEREVDVLNLSLSGPRDALLERLVAVAIDADVIVVAAQPDGPRAAAFPAGVDGVIPVLAAEGDEAQRADGSLFAPGREILTLAPGDHYDYSSGSSVAAAYVSGIAALIREVRPQIGSSALRDVLVRSSAQPGTPAEPLRLVVNACAALADLVGGADCPATVAAAASTASDRPRLAR